MTFISGLNIYLGPQLLCFIHLEVWWILPMHTRSQGQLKNSFYCSFSVQSVSAFSPICNPINCPWGVKAFSGYLGNDKESWKVSIMCLIWYQNFVMTMQIWYVDKKKNVCRVKSETMNMASQEQKLLKTSYLVEVWKWFIEVNRDGDDDCSSHFNSYRSVMSIWTFHVSA